MLSSRSRSHDFFIVYICPISDQPSLCQSNPSLGRRPKIKQCALNHKQEGIRIEHFHYPVETILEADPFSKTDIPSSSPGAALGQQNVMAAAMFEQVPLRSVSIRTAQIGEHGQPGLSAANLSLGSLTNAAALAFILELSIFRQIVGAEALSSILRASEREALLIAVSSTYRTRHLLPPK
jgi:hypothetical protein